METKEIKEAFQRVLNADLDQITVSGQKEKNDFTKVKVRPVSAGGALRFQAEEIHGKQAFHKNLTASEAADYLTGLMETGFQQAQIEGASGNGTILVSKKGRSTVKIRQKAAKPERTVEMLSHNRKKRYILEEGTPVPFLYDLGVQTKEGKIVHSRYDKFRQINRFLEFIEDILPKLDKTRENTILDFGCGKSYLTFAMYYYLHELRGYEINVIGLDLKEDVIENCNGLAVKYGYDHLKFYTGDIASYEGVSHVDLVVTLHACDTATDFALAKAVQWGAKVILSVPCCQHELNKVMQNDLFAPVFQYGIIKERVAALYTDGLRAQILEHMGYRVQLLEFIDMEHTPKNILIRAVLSGNRKDNRREIEDIMEFLHGKPTLYRLLMEEEL